MQRYLIRKRTNMHYVLICLDFQNAHFRPCPYRQTGPCPRNISVRTKTGSFYIRLEAIAIRSEAIASRLEAIASRLEAIAIGLNMILMLFLSKQPQGNAFVGDSLHLWAWSLELCAAPPARIWFGDNVSTCRWVLFKKHDM